MAKLMIVPSGADALPEAPYPAEILARGWSFDVDLPRVQQSDTWSLAPPELRPWLLMLWATSWLNAPCGTYPNDDQVIAARIGMPLAMFRTHREALMRGWMLHRDGRLYHNTVSEKVLRMIHMRLKDRQRMAQRRIENQEVSQNVRKDSTEVHASHTGVRVESASVRDSPSPSPKEKTYRAALQQSSWLCPDGIDSHAWQDWMKLRKAKRAATSERAYTAVMTKIADMHAAGIDASAVVTRSADKGWTDLYPPSGNGAVPQSKYAASDNYSPSFGAFDTTGTMPLPPPPKA